MSEVKRYRFIEDSDPDLMRAGRIYGATDGDLCAYAELEAAQSELTALREELANAERKNVDQSNYLREALKRINVNQHHMFCLALDDFLNSAEPKPTESGASE